MMTRPAHTFVHSHSPSFPISVYPPSTPLPSSLSLLGDMYMVKMIRHGSFTHAHLAIYIRLSAHYNSITPCPSSTSFPIAPSPWPIPFPSPSSSPAPPLLSSTQLDVCRRNCLIYFVFKNLLNQDLTEVQCQAICASNVRLNLCITLHIIYT